MSIEIKVPVLPESVSDATIASWHKKPGEFVKRDEHLVDIETDKVVLEVVAPEDGCLEAILKAEGSAVGAQETIALFKAGQADAKAGQADAKAGKANSKVVQAEKTPTSASVSSAPQMVSNQMASQMASDKSSPNEILSPAERRRVQEQGSGLPKRQEQAKTETLSEKKKSSATVTPLFEDLTLEPGTRLEKRVPMTRLRARIAERLLEAQRNAAILTTFNEINMAPVMELRKKYKETFEKNYGVRLGLMSFFTLAVIEALKHFPIINASVDGHDIVYHGYYDIGIAVSSPRGLVVPVLKDAQNMTMDEIERHIVQYAKKAETGQLSLEEITGGTFTITNGGVFGSLMATPILNPPQSAILGMHKIEERPIADNGQVVIRPMMYVALSYDHRIIDGAESVRFLVTVKELLEDPARLALGI